MSKPSRTGGVVRFKNFAAGPDAELPLDATLLRVGAQLLRLAKLEREAKSASQSGRASAKRKQLSKADLVAFRAEFAKQHGKERGWRKAACLHFGIRKETLRDRMGE